MDKFDIISLSSRKIPTEVSHFYLSYRVHNTHVFSSIDEAIEWTTNMITKKHINPDYMEMCLNNSSEDLFKINTIDEAICSICYELFKQYSVRNIDFIMYHIVNLINFSEIIDTAEYIKNNIKIDLKNLIMHIINIYLPLESKTDIEIREDEYTNQLASLYYKLLFDLYNDDSIIQDSYIVKMKIIYNNLLNKIPVVSNNFYLYWR